ncbi:MAG: cyclic-phosphate processing receiver domain-containing protein [Candidatus Hodarchaeota archaeon]
MKVWLDDDEREAPEGWIWEKDPSAVVDMIASGKVAEISLDCDLGAGITGYIVLAWLERMVGRDFIGKVPKIQIHTANPIGRKRMEQAVKSIRKLDEANKINRSHKLDFWKREG